MATVVATLSKTLSIQGVAVSSTETWSDEGSIYLPITLSAGKSGTLSTRTGNSDGIVTATAHGYTDATTFAVYWTGGVRYGMTCSSYNANTVTLTGGSGTNFPIQGTAVTLCSETVLDVAFTGNDAYALWVSSNRAGHVDFRSSAPASLWAETLTANIAAEWSNGSAHTNPLTDVSPATVRVSNGTTNTATLHLCVVKEATA